LSNDNIDIRKGLLTLLNFIAVAAFVLQIPPSCMVGTLVAPEWPHAPMLFPWIIALGLAALIVGVPTYFAFRVEAKGMLTAAVILASVPIIVAAAVYLLWMCG
jgi:hypothetical protein